MRRITVTIEIIDQNDETRRRSLTKTSENCELTDAMIEESDTMEIAGNLYGLALDAALNALDEDRIEKGAH